MERKWKYERIREDRYGYSRRDYDISTLSLTTAEWVLEERYVSAEVEEDERWGKVKGMKGQLGLCFSPLYTVLSPFLPFFT